MGTVYSIAGPVLGGLPQTTLTVDAQAGVLRGPDGRPVRPRYLLVDEGFTPTGRVVARDESKEITLYELDGPVRAPEKVTGLYPDTWSTGRVRYTRHACRGGVLRVQLRGDPSLFTELQTITARIDGEVVVRVTMDPAEKKELVVPLQPRGESCVVTFSISPTGVPAELTRRLNTDMRVLGVHFDRLDYVKP